MNCLHPVRLLTRTDADINTLYHSFFLIQYLPSTKELKTIKKISNSKSDINNIESGLGIFVIDIVKNSTETERSGICVVTTSSGIRYYAFLRSYKNKVFAAVACLPIISFTRRLLDLLVFEEKDVLTNMLLVLCELPVVPVAGLQYKIELTAGVAELKFSAIEQAEDSDIDILIISVLTPKMIVRAWEAIVLERKVLVVSSIDSIITACCEFFRRLALPLFIVNTYVPLLPEQLIESVEAPFPYLLGANTNIIRKAGVDLSDTVIIDLDNRDVIPVRNSTSFPADSRAPTNLIAKLMIEVNEILLKPLGNWLQRADSSQPYNSCEKVGTVNSPICEESFKLRATMISQLFIRTNLSLISSRTCTVRAFFRRPKVEGTINEDFSDLNLQQNPKRKACTSMGYHFSGGIHSGFMQLVKERNEDDDAGPNFIPCWVEMDSRIFSVYEHADSLPVIYVMNREIDSVSPSPLEPEGHVFELVLKDQSSYRFTTTDSDSRRAWISIIEKTQRSNSQENGFAASNGASPPLKEPSAVETISPSHIRSNSVNPTHMNGELHKSQASSPAPSVGGDETDTDSLRIGLPIAAEDSRSLDIESYEDSIFRYYIMKTQMMSSLKSHLESQEYDTLARENDITLSELIMNKFDKRFLKYVRKSGPILSILEQLKNEDIEDIDKIPIPVFDDDDDSDLDFLRHSETRLSHQDEIKRDYSPNFPRALSTSAAITSSNAVLMNNGNAVSPPTGTNFASEKNRRGSSLLGGFFSRRSSDNKVRRTS